MFANDIKLSPQFQFIVLAFIVVVAIIMLSENLTSAMVVLAVFVNFLAIYAHFKKIGMGNTKINLLGNGDDSSDGGNVSNVNGGNSKDNDKTPDNESPATNLTNMSIYGPEYDAYDSYKMSYLTSYDEPKPVDVYLCGENTSNIDSANAYMAQRRNRDKRAMDGAITKTANYYKYHFTDELEKAEKREWWGNNDK